jgi:hypothetical protein
MAAGDGPVVAVDTTETVRWPPAGGTLACRRAAAGTAFEGSLGAGLRRGLGAVWGPALGSVLGVVRAALPPPAPRPRIPGRAEVLERVAGIGGARSAPPADGGARADLVIRPEPDGTGPWDWERLEVLRELGRAAAQDAFDAHGPLVP